MASIGSMEITLLLQQYRDGELTPETMVQQCLDRASEFDEHNIWIHRLSLEEIQPYLKRLEGKSPEDLPLYGIPFAIKDNIDLAACPTTAACKAYDRVPETSATVVELLLEAGAIPLGKTNMDQFATGLVGSRSPWGVVKNAFDPDYISGGSSSGSAMAVALGLVSFSLGTDTAGSGRVPAAFNNIVGLKPSRGLLSTRGVVPACRSLDCVSIFALSAYDAHQVFTIAQQQDSEDAFSRAYNFRNLSQIFGKLQSKPRVGVIAADALECFGDEETRTLYRDACEQMRTEGFETVTIDFSPFTDAARLLYEGPWVTERYIASRDFLDNMLDVTRSIISKGKDVSAQDCFLAQYQLAEIKNKADRIWKTVDIVMTPTVPGHYQIDEIDKEPVVLNSQLGYYTNFMNLLDYSAVAVPFDFRANGLPFGVTLFAPAFKDINLLSVANHVQHFRDMPLGKSKRKFSKFPLDNASDGNITVAVCGAHLEGLPLNWQLLQRDAILLEKTATAPCYKFYALAGGPPMRPGLIRSEYGSAIEVELWSVPSEFFGSFVAGIPQPLGIGKVELEDGRWVVSFICEAYGIEAAQDITGLKSWRRYLQETET